MKKQAVTVEDLYTMSRSDRYNDDGGWNHKALIALGISGFLSIGFSLLGAYGLIFNVGDWGWLIGARAGALVYGGLSGQSAPLAAAVPGK